MPASVNRYLRLASWRLINAMPRKEIIIRTENGVLGVSSKDWMIGKKLYVDRGFEAAEIDAAVAALRGLGWLKSGRATLVDAGANVGMISIAMLLRGHFQRAVAFEPTEATFRLLVRNVQRNGLAGAIRAVPLALSASEGELELGLSRDNSGDNRIERAGAGPGRFHEERRRRVRIPATSLTGWLTANDMDAAQIGLIWLDVQGHEAYALRGFGDLLREIPVVTEIWPYALERSGLGVAQFLGLVGKFFSGFFTLPAPSAPLPVNRLESFMEALGRSPRGMAQIVLLPRAGGRTGHPE